MATKTAIAESVTGYSKAKMHHFKRIFVIVCSLWLTVFATPLDAQVIHTWTNFSNTDSFWDGPTNWDLGFPPTPTDGALFAGTNLYEVWWDSFTGNTQVFGTVVFEANVTFLNQGSGPISHSTEVLNIEFGSLDVHGLQLTMTNGGGIQTGSVNLAQFTIDGSHPAGSHLTQFEPDSFNVESGTMHLVSGGTAAIDNLVVQGNGVVTIEGPGTNLSCQLLTVGASSLFAELEVFSNGSLNTDFLFLGNSTNGTATISGAGSQATINQLIVGDTGFPGTLNITDDGNVSVAVQTILGDEATVAVSGGGHFDFATMEIDQLLKIVGSNGSIAGDVFNAQTNFAASLSGLQGIDLDTANLFLNNTGTLLGAAILDCSLVNSGEVRILDGEYLSFTPLNGGVANEGEINSLGGVLDVYGAFDNCGFVAGRGLLASGDGFINAGVLAFNGTTDFIGDVFNDGQIINSAGATLTFFDDLEHNGQEIRTSAGGNTVIFGGATGSGNYTGTGTVYFEGDLQPGNSPGIVQFEGDVVLGSSTSTEIELQGETSGQFDRLEIVGAAQLDGTLAVSTLGGFEPTAGMEFQIIVVDGIATGQFTGLPEGATVATTNGVNLKISYQGGDGNDVVLQAEAQFLPGDVNLDGAVNLLDVKPFIALLSSGVFQAEADINQDGEVNLLDVQPFIELLAGG